MSLQRKSYLVFSILAWLWRSAARLVCSLSFLRHSRTLGVGQQGQLSRQPGLRQQFRQEYKKVVDALTDRTETAAL